ncbi:LysE family translocator [Comamonas thiooxydans]|uniref:LysE family transporter n=1 Tax=Comamonas thiooxydans TaxID=363952 RepID=UPI00244C920F|nr:LysE family transporter [Comamonas thiooxydans]MDH1474932.1 LysE family translocator [Comamonas thiooxydans]
MLMLFASAFVLGLVFNAAPGAVFAETLRQGVRGGYRPALAVQLGSLVGDASWALLGLAGIGLVMQVDALRWPIGLAGAAYLFWLSWDSWQAARTEHRLDAPATTAATQKQALRRGMALSLTNPQNLAYWAAMGSALGAVGVAHPGASDYGLFFAGFMTSSLLWCFVCAALVDRLFRRAAAHWSRFTYRCCAALLLALALGTLRDLLGTNPAALPPAAQQQSLR